MIRQLEPCCDFSKANIEGSLDGWTLVENVLLVPAFEYCPWCGDRLLAKQISEEEKAFLEGGKQ